MRHSSGWKEMLKNLQRRESLRILDIGPTSSGNINFVTGMGHSIYMSNFSGRGRAAGVVETRCGRRDTLRYFPHFSKRT